MNQPLSNPRRDGRINDSEHQRRMNAARAVAEWELGSASWAGTLIGAYLDPDGALEGLAARKAVYDQ